MKGKCQKHGNGYGTNFFASSVYRDKRVLLSAAKKPWIWWMFFLHNHSLLLFRLANNQLQFKKNKRYVEMGLTSNRQQRIRNKFQYTTW
jgi:hypothetical protein